MTRVSTSRARTDFSETVNRVAYGGERIVLERRGRNIAAIVPIEDLELLAELENRTDLDAARRALKEKGSISWKKLKTKLGL